MLDAELTLDLPEQVTISSGADAISHVLESVWNKAASPVSLAFATHSLQLSLAALPRLRQGPDDLQARQQMLQASLLAGLAISQTRTALAHSISYPLTTQFGLPHGLACSFTLPSLMRFNVEADDGRLSRLAFSLGFSRVEDFARELEALFHSLGMRAYVASAIPDQSAAMALTAQMFTPGRADNNLREATVDDVRGILATALAAAAIHFPHP